jgi:hypothetical protein
MPLLSSNSVLLLLDKFLRDEAELVKFNKPPAIQRNPALQKISRISRTEKALISLVSITEFESIILKTIQLLLSCPLTVTRNKHFQQWIIYSSSGYAANLYIVAKCGNMSKLPL